MNIAPVTLTYADGSKIILTRDGDVVSFTAIAGTNPNIAVAKPIPANFFPAGNVSSYIADSEDAAWYVSISEVPSTTGFIGIVVGAIKPAPWKTFSGKWIADPLTPVPDGYILNPQSEQDSITAFLRTTYPHIPVIEDGLLDDDNDSIKYNLDGSIRPFIVLWYSNAKRSAKGRSFVNYKLDSHFATVDVVVVARSGKEARIVLNDVSDKLVGFRTGIGGRMHKGAALWGDSRNIIQDKDRPTRFARTDRFDFGIQARKIA